MKLNLYEEKNIQNEHVDVYYSNMRPVIRQIIDTVNSERPKLRGRQADEDLDDGEEVYIGSWRPCRHARKCSGITASSVYPNRI